MDNRKPLVSIIVPVYNVEKYLPQCLDSLIGQTLQPIEIICINDCSPDDSIAILNQYAQKDQRIKVISLPENRRQGGARNIGIREATADYIGFVDSDDWVAPTMYERLYETAQRTHADIVSPLWYFCSYDNQNNKTINGTSLEGISQPERNKKIILNGFRLVTSIFRKDLFFENDLFFPEKVLFEDNAIAAALHLSAKNIVQIEDCSYYYRCSNISTSRGLDNYHFFDRLDTSLLYLENMKRLGFYESYKEEIDYAFIGLYYRNTLIECFTRFSKPEHTPMQKIIDNMHEILPNYKRNKYYRQSPLKYRMILRLCELNLPLAIATYKVIRKIRKRKTT